MRTTIRLDDDLLREAKRKALEHGCTLTELIEDSLRERLARKAGVDGTEPVRLHTVGEGGLQPGVDLDDSAALLERMDEGG
jgi:hypothetical protein